MNNRKELQEIGHSGGTVTFSVKVIDGRLAYQVGWSHSRPNAAALFAVYALPQGIVLDDIALEGIGAPWNAPPVPGCFPVFVSSDSSGMFGAECPECHGYWRSRHPSNGPRPNPGTTLRNPERPSAREGSSSDLRAGIGPSPA